MRIFTKSFFARSYLDRVQIVDSVLNDLRTALAQAVGPQDRQRLRRQIRRIERKAEELGIFDAGEKSADGGAS